MTMIDQNTSRGEMLTAIYSDWSIIDHFMGKDMDPEFMDDDAIRNEIMEWIEIGGECIGH